MKVQFNRHRKYGKDDKAGITHEGLDCKPGVHEVPDALKQSKYFQAHLKAGDCSILAAPKGDDQSDADDGKGKQPAGKGK